MGMFESTPRTLAWLRVRRGLQQKELSERSGIGRAAISRYESGKASPSLSSLGRLLKALDVTPVEFARTLVQIGEGDEGSTGPRRPDPRTLDSLEGVYMVVDLAEAEGRRGRRHGGRSEAELASQLERAVQAARRIRRRGKSPADRGEAAAGTKGSGA